MSCSFDDRVIKYQELRERLEKLSKKHISYLKTYYGAVTESEGRTISSLYGFSRPRLRKQNDDDKEDDSEIKLHAGLLSTCFVAISLKKSKSQKEVSKVFGDDIYDKCRNLILNRQWAYFSINEFNYFAEERLLEFDLEDVIKDEYGDIKKINEKKIQMKGEKPMMVDMEKIQILSKGKPYDIYSTPIILLALDSIDTDYEIRCFEKSSIKKGIDEILYNLNQNRGAARYGKKYPFSGFLTYLSFMALLKWFNRISELQKKSGNTSKYDEELSDIQVALYKSYIWSKQQLYKQISFYKTNNFERTDPIRCIFTLAIYKMYFEHIKDNPVRFTIRQKSQEFIDEVIKLVFDDQQENGLWKKYLPIFALPNDGNVYPFALYSLDILLDTASPSTSLFNEFTSNIEGVIKWIEVNEKEGTVESQGDFEEKHIPSKSENDIIKEKFTVWADKPVVKGWRSNHSTKPFEHPEAWSTALVFDSILNLETIVKRNVTQEIIDEYKGDFSFKIDRYDFFRRTDSFFTVNDTEEKLSLKLTIYETFLAPRKGKGIFDKIPNAAILYGPPGTGKTSITKAIAKYLGWSYLRIDTSIFLRNGLDMASKNIEKVFNHLKELDKTVIIFDEIDEFIQNRNTNENISRRLLTNTMLTKLNDLKDNSNIIYFVSTNCFGKIDPAIQRPGRFDCILEVGYLDKKSMLLLTDQTLKKLANVETLQKDTNATRIYLTFKKFIANREIGDNKIESTHNVWENFVRVIYQKFSRIPEEDELYKKIESTYKELEELLEPKTPEQKNEQDECYKKNYSRLSELNFGLKKIKLQPDLGIPTYSEYYKDKHEVIKNKPEEKDELEIYGLEITQGLSDYEIPID